MNYESDPSYLGRLQREAQTCLSGFPNKVRALNDIIATYAPEMTKRNLQIKEPKILGLPQPENSDADDCNPEKLNPSVTSASETNQCVSLIKKMSKKKHHCARRFDRKIHRRRPGPLAHILAFLSNSLALCTKATVIRPSQYIANQALIMLRDSLVQRGQLINVQCGPSSIWSLPEGRTSLELQIDLGATLNNCIGIMRPAAAQLIADTTKLKRWLQALALTYAPPTPSLTHAIRRTEAVDGWAYELFFHLKYLQENRIRNLDKIGWENSTDTLWFPFWEIGGKSYDVELNFKRRIVASMGFKVNDEIRYANLLHRLIQLRDNYVYLYEILYNDDQFQKLQRESAERICN